MKIKIALLLVVVLVVGLATIPLWGNCDQAFEGCKAWCELRHVGGSAIQLAACKADCGADKAGCLAGEGAKSLGDFLDGAGSR